MKCEYCDRENTDENKVEFQKDPYESEINNDNTEHWICGICYDNKSDEI